MLTSIHILLTYTCTLRCNHCFVYGSPQATGKASSTRVAHTLDQAFSLKTVEWVIFEGGEPFLVFPLLLSSIKRARQLGFKVGVITNGYFGRSEEAAVRYLKPLVALGLNRIFISNDRYHYKNTTDSPAKRAISAAVRLGLPTTRLKINDSALIAQIPEQDEMMLEETRPLIMVGRANEKLRLDLPLFDWRSFTYCPFKELKDPDTIFIDPLGFAQICQGISIGNIWSNSLSDLMERFDLDSHPIYGPLFYNGPKGLAEKYEITPLQGYQNACQVCYEVRRLLLGQFPDHLSPPQLYNSQI